MYAIAAVALLATAYAIPARRDLSNVSPSSFDEDDVYEVPHLHHIGAPGEPRIVGGAVASAHQFPYQAALFVPVALGLDFCSGSVISSEWILTAAHCVDERLGSVEVVLGAQDVEFIESSQVTLVSSEIYQHPKWNRSILQNDIALIKLPRKIEFSANVQAVKLPSKSELAETFDGVESTLSGWGKTSDGSMSISPDLRYVTLPVLSNSVCHDYFSRVVDTHICTSGSAGKSACNGDSGGPLVIQESDGSKTQIGIVSFGGQSCEQGDPDVYTRTTSFVEWISEKTSIPIRN